MAALWKLPAVFICENNHYGMGTPVARHSAEQEFHKRLGKVPGFSVDGLNVFAVREALAFAKRYCPENGPLCLNIKTYRYHGHSMSDPGISYRTREEVQTVRKEKDCIVFLKRLAIENGFATEDEIKAIELEAKVLVDDAAHKAEAQPEWPLSSVFENIYAVGHDGKKI
jgi:pyruvate dehydrogenase E1 component alpha subunit